MVQYYGRRNAANILKHKWSSENYSILLSTTWTAWNYRMKRCEKLFNNCNTVSMLHKDYPTYITNSKETWKKNDNNKQARHRRANRPNQWSLLRGPTSMFRSVEDFKNSQLALILILSAEIFTKFSNWKNISSLLEYLLHWKKKRSSFMVVYRKYVNCKYARLCLRLSFYKSQRMRCNLSFSSFSSIFRLRIRIFKMAQKISYFSVKSTTTWSNAVR